MQWEQPTLDTRENDRVMSQIDQNESSDIVSLILKSRKNERLEKLSLPKQQNLLQRAIEHLFFKRLFSQIVEVYNNLI